MNKKKLLKYIITIFILIIIILIVYLMRNYFIIKSLEKNFYNISNTNNYYVKQTTNQASTISVLEMYKKENKGKLIEHLISLNDFQILEMTTIFDNKITTYMNLGTEKIKKENSMTQQLEIPNPYKLYSKESDSNIIVELFKTHIYTITYNNKECYLITNSLIKNMYIDKETGLLLKLSKGISTTEKGETQEIENIYYYNFGTITDEDIKISNIADFK